MREDNLDELDDDALYESYEAYKALLDAGVSKSDALKKTGLTPQIIKDFEEEEKDYDDEYKSEFKEVWGQDDEDFDESDWQEADFEEEDSWEEDSYSDYEEGYGNDEYDDKEF